MASLSSWSKETVRDMMGTAQIAGLISGEKLYQIRARKALPLLVRQARSEQTIFYSDLAAELKIPNPRNLGLIHK